MSRSPHNGTVAGKLLLVFPFVLLFGLLAQADDGNGYYRLTIETYDEKYTYPTAELLAREDIETVTIKDVSAYPRQSMTFRALKTAYLLRDIPIDGNSRVEFVARDGFTANLDPAVLLDTSAGSATAYLAIEDPARPWPPYAHHMTPDEPTDETAGPFYLFWLNPELSDIRREEWPFKFNRIIVKSSLRENYPEIFPDATVADSELINAGFEVFIKNCFSCHQVNRAGHGAMGPDLNYPLSPTEYFREGMLKRFIRDPQSIRHNPATTMGAFPESIISDDELDHLLVYLEHMAELRDRQ
ncbi:MAG: cytochrome c [Gammaproteobacteria bacterium]|nr:cytochrome c [Gammaproteobacteria bacterium]